MLSCEILAAKVVPDKCYQRSVTREVRLAEEYSDENDDL